MFPLCPDIFAGGGGVVSQKNISYFVCYILYYAVDSFPISINFFIRTISAISFTDAK